MSDVTDASAIYDFSVLRTLRKRGGMTLHELAESSGVPVGVISKIEQNQSKGDIDTLYRLSRAIGISTSELVGLAESRLAQRVEAETYDNQGFDFERITYRNVRIFRVRAKQGGTVSRPEVHGDDYEICWVNAGRVGIRFAHETHVLGAGEAMQFDAIHEHAYEALENLEMTLVQIRKNKRC